MRGLTNKVFNLILIVFIVFILIPAMLVELIIVLFCILCICCSEIFSGSIAHFRKKIPKK